MVKKDIDLDDDLENLEEQEDSKYSDLDGDIFADDNLGLDSFGGESLPPMEKHSDLLKQLTDFDDYHKNLINDWLGLTWNEKDKTYSENKNVEPIMNKKGALWCIGLLRTYTRKNNIITWIGKEEYKQIMWEVIEVLWLNIGTRYDEFGIKKDGDILKICNILEHSISLILMGAGEGKYSKLLSETTNRNENLTLQPAGGAVMTSQSLQQPMETPRISTFNKTMNYLKGR